MSDFGSYEEEQKYYEDRRKEIDSNIPREELFDEHKPLYDRIPQVINLDNVNYKFILFYDRKSNLYRCKYVRLGSSPIGFCKGKTIEDCLWECINWVKGLEKSSGNKLLVDTIIKPNFNSEYKYDPLKLGNPNIGADFGEIR